MQCKNLRLHRIHVSQIIGFTEWCDIEVTAIPYSLNFATADDTIALSFQSLVSHPLKTLEITRWTTPCFPEWKTQACLKYNYAGSPPLSSLTLLPARGVPMFPTPPQGQVNTKRRIDKGGGQMWIKHRGKKDKRKISYKETLLIAC